MATENELAALVSELGLDGDEAGDLVKGLTGSSIPDKSNDLKSENVETKEEEIKEIEE